MGCSAQQVLNDDFKPIIHGDLFNSDTRNVLSILDIGEVDFVFKATNPMSSIDAALSAAQTMGIQRTQSIQDIGEISTIAPIIEDRGAKKVIGSSQEIVIYACTKDCRNKPKLNAKGKPIKPKKGTKPAISLYAPEARQEIDRMLNWFLTKFRPYSQHMFRQILSCLK